MDDLVPDKTIIHITEGPGKGEKIVYPGGALLHTSTGEYSLFWSRRYREWRARPNTEDRTRPLKIKKEWDICFNCHWYLSNPGTRHQKLKDGKCTRTNNFHRVLKIESCNHYSRRLYGTYSSRQSLSKQTR